MESRRIIGSVLDVLEMKSPSNPVKTITEVILDGSYTDADLRSIYRNETFPSNKFNELSVPEGEYGQQEAMIAFVNTISPYLSDQALYQLTDRIMGIETELLITQTLRTATILKPLLWAEINRQTPSAVSGRLPDTLTSHLYRHILPLCKEQWPTTIENTINTFVSFNIMQGGALTDSLSQEAQSKFTKANTVSAYELISTFDAAEFNPSSLSEVARNPAEFQTELASLRTEYDAQRRNYESGAAANTQGPKISAQEAAAMRAFEQRQAQAKAQQATSSKPVESKAKLSLKGFGRSLSQRFKPSSPGDDTTFRSPPSVKPASAPVIRESDAPKANKHDKKPKERSSLKAKLSRVSSRLFHKPMTDDNIVISSPSPVRRESAASVDAERSESTASPELTSAENLNKRERQYDAASANVAVSKHISKDDFFMHPGEAAYSLSIRPNQAFIIHLSNNDKYQITYRDAGEIKHSRELWGVAALEGFLASKILPKLAEPNEQPKPVKK